MNTAVYSDTLPPAHSSPPLAGKPDGYLFGRTRSLQTFSLFCLLMVFDFADRMVMAALLPSIRQEWQISDAQAGLLSTVLFIGMVLFAFPLSFAIDRWSRVKTAGLMGAFWSVASALGAFSQNVAQLAATRAAVGVGEAGYAPAAYAWISTVFPYRRRQLALGTFSACQPIGMAIGVALGGTIAAHFGWRHALGFLALPGLLVAWLLYRANDYPTVRLPDRNSALLQDGSARVQRTANLRRIFKTPSLVLAYVAAALAMFQALPLFYFFPTYLNRIHGVPVQTASLLTSSMMLVGIVAVPSGGLIMDRWNQHNPLGKLSYGTLVALLATALYGAALGLVDNYPLQFGLIVLGMFIMASGGTTALSMTQELVPPHLRALSGTCSVVTIHLLGSAPGPYVTGLLSDAFGLTNALLGSVVVAGLLSAAALLLARRYYRADLERVAHWTAGAA